MLRKIIKRIFNIGNAELKGELSKRYDIASNAMHAAHEEIHERIRSLTLSPKDRRYLNDKFSNIHKQIANPSGDVTLTRRERLALDYALKLPKLRVLNYPPVGTEEEMTRQHYKDTAKECVLYADKMIAASETPADDCG